MPIKYHKLSQTFHLYNNEISYIFKILKNNQLGHLYYGKAIRDKDNYDYLLETYSRGMSVCTFENDSSFSLDHIKQEYPTYGTGDMHHPAIDITLENGSHIVNFVYKQHEIIKGKPSLENLPATYVEDNNESTTLKITLYDDVIETYLILSYTIYENRNVITRNAYIKNNGKQKIVINQIMSMSLDLPDKDYEMIELTGAWARERYVKNRKLEHGIQSIYSLRGCSSNAFNPFIALKREHCDEYQGEVLGFSLVYSGNFLAQVDVDTYNVSRVSMGIHPHCFGLELNKNEDFQTPEVVIVYSDNGLNGMSQTYHSLYQERLCRGKYRDLERPILINNWEATYFDFDEDKILEIAKKAKELGIELFVLDDGWFGKRNDDHRGLGDWYPNLNKIPSGISGLSRKINDLGMKFGLWVELEMVNKDSDLYREHPEYTLETPQRHSSHGRNQYVLDFSNDEVVQYIYKMISKVIEESHIDYIKWDMNRCMSEVYSSCHNSHEQGKVMHEYILGVYHLYDKLTKKFPNILFESCSSGGARFDPGMLYYAPQCWTSDNTDAIERLKIQYGTSFVYPLSSMGSHVSAVPNHQICRNTTLDTRAHVAYFGSFGYELDITKLSIDKQNMVKQQVEFMKAYRRLIQFGTFYRLKSPFEDNETIWMVVSKDKSQALVGYYRTLQEINVGYRRIKLLGLNKNYSYHVSLLDQNFYGDELMNVGLITSDSSSSDHNDEGDFVSRIYVLKAN
ncbi:MAG: alpha-galactosidase [Erysipelotrichaceae bacterium]|nr:alpha-galactosidase [Erysipelotrichaceae bacterium]